MNKKKILIIDSKERLSQELNELQVDFICERVDIQLGLKTNLLSNTYQMVIITQNTDYDEDLELFKAIQAHFEGPIIYILTQANTKLKIKFLQVGLDDVFETKIDPLELSLKCLRIIERTYCHQKIKSGPFEIDVVDKVVTFDGVVCKMPNKPYQLLLYLIKNEGKDLSRSQIFHDVWQYDDEFSKRLVDTNISFLRRHTDKKYFISLRGKGYRFELN